MNEQEALARLRQGDLRGLETLVRSYQREAMRLATLITRDRALAEDAVSDSFLTVRAKIDLFDPDRPFRPWFFRIVTNACLKALRARRRVVTLEDLEAAEAVLWNAGGQTGSRRGPEERMERMEAIARVRQALRTLTPIQRTAIALRYYGGLSEAEMAAALDIPRGTVKSRLAAGIGRLRALLGETEMSE